MLKKVLSISLTFLLATVLLAGCGQKSDSQEIKLGAVFPLTGDVSAMGQSCKNALQMLEEETNANGGINGKKVKFSFEDDENKPSNSANAIQKLINSDKVVGVVGSYASKCSISMGPIATSNEVPMISVSTSPKVTKNGGDYVFTSTFNDTFQGTIIAKIAAEDLKAKTAAVLYDVGNDYDKGLNEFFTTNFKKLGGKVLTSATFNAGDQDFSAQLTNIKKLNPDVLILPDYYGTVALIAKQARDLGITSTFIGGDGWDSPALFDIGGTSVNGSYFSNFFSTGDTTPGYIKFRQGYEKKYGKTPDAIAASSYNAGSLLIEAIKKADSTEGSKIRDALKNIDFEGVAGKTKYDSNRNAIMGGDVIKIENQKQVFVRKVSQ
ncbi:ABC transporter substrate-binding protein [Clostridium sp. WILCCON 0269]|uniref:ABC transporter substrate-binding protein n=1 Tax=Candidatus Clostridium eludens TaxID=3381663 RepID=A0ABW8SHV6_9CLOT